MTEFVFAFDGNTQTAAVWLFRYQVMSYIKSTFFKTTDFYSRKSQKQIPASYFLLFGHSLV